MRKTGTDTKRMLEQAYRKALGQTGGTRTFSGKVTRFYLRERCPFLVNAERLVESAYFKIIVCVLILLNAAYIGVTSDAMVKDALHFFRQQQEGLDAGLPDEAKLFTSVDTFSCLPLHSK